MDKHDDFYTPKQVDEQLEAILRTEQANTRDLRLIDDLLTEFSTEHKRVASIDEENERVLARVLARLHGEDEQPHSREQSIPFANYSGRRTHEKGEHQMNKISASQREHPYGEISRPSSPFLRRLNMLAAVLALLVLVGALLVVLHLARQNQQGSHGVAPSVIQSPGIYINNASHLFRLNATTHQVVWQQAVKDTAQIIPAGNVVYVLQERDSVLELDANSGTILWKHPFPMPGQTPSNLHRNFQATNMVLSQGRIYVAWETWATPNQIDSKQTIQKQVTNDEGWIFVLNTSNGSQYAAYPKTAVSSLAVGDGVMAIGDRSSLQLYDATSGKPLWHVSLPGGEGSPVRALSIVNNLVYPIISNSTKDITGNGQSYIAAYNISSGKQVWRSPTFPGDALYDFTVDQNVIYFGALTPGRVYAYDVQNNKQLWSKMVDGNAAEPLVVSKGVIYTVADQGSHARAHLVALDTATGTIKWQYTLRSSFLGSFCISNDVVYINSTNYAPNDPTPAQIDALNANNGITIWEYSQPGTGNIVSTD